MKPRKRAGSPDTDGGTRRSTHRSASGLGEISRTKSTKRFFCTSTGPTQWYTPVASGSVSATAATTRDSSVARSTGSPAASTVTITWRRWAGTSASAFFQKRPVAIGPARSSAGTGAGISPRYTSASPRLKDTCRSSLFSSVAFGHWGQSPRSAAITAAGSSPCGRSSASRRNAIWMSRVMAGTRRRRRGAVEPTAPFEPTEWLALAPPGRAFGRFGTVLWQSPRQCSSEWKERPLRCERSMPLRFRGP